MAKFFDRGHEIDLIVLLLDCYAFHSVLNFLKEDVSHVLDFTI
jgi:hypothetical protein